MPGIRVANAAGFWGDWLEAPRLTVESAEVEYLTLEYLAELTLSVLAHLRSRDPQAGFVTDFPLALKTLIPAIQAQQQLKIVTNAGGINPQSCVLETARLLEQQGCSEYRIGVVTGDDLLPRWDELKSMGEQFEHMETREPLGARENQIVSVNAYLGAFGITEALARDARIVITGRCADASLTLGPAMKEFGWSWNDWDLIAAATVAGHLIECGAQVTGGMYSRWTESMDLTNVGYPIAELTDVGGVCITKPAGTDGEVSVGTVSEQLIYEIGDPAHYLTPDVDVDFTRIQLKQLAEDRVEVIGAKGGPAPEHFKVSLAYRDGFAVSSTLVVSGRHAERKARQCGEMILRRLQLAGCEPQSANIEILGTGDSLPGIWPRHEDSQAQLPPGEVVLRLTARDPKREILERLTREIAPLVTSGPPGVTGYTGPRSKPYPVLGFWPTTIAREHIVHETQVKTVKEWLA